VEAIKIMINLTPTAAVKVKEIMSMQTPRSGGRCVLPLSVAAAPVFQYHMAFEKPDQRFR